MTLTVPQFHCERSEAICKRSAKTECRFAAFSSSTKSPKLLEVQLLDVYSRRLIPERNETTMFARAARAYLSELDVSAPADFDAMLGKVTQAIGLAYNQEGGISDRTVAAGWRSFLNLEKSTSRDEIAQICVLGAFHSFMSSTPSMKAAFSEQRLNFARSRVEMSLRLASRLYMLGRKAKFGTPALADGLRLLKVSILNFNEAAADGESSLQSSALSKLFGMRGVARLLVARAAGSPLEELRLAASDLHRSNQNGDNSTQNLVYRRECALRICEIECKSGYLEQLGELLIGSSLKDRQYYTDLSWYHCHRAQLASADDQDAREPLLLGLQACNAALELSADLNTPNAIIFNLRGFLHFLFFQNQVSKIARVQSILTSRSQIFGWLPRLASGAHHCRWRS